MAGIVTNSLNFAIIFVFFMMTYELQNARIFPNRRILRDLSKFMEQAVPNFFSILLSFWGWDQMTLISGILGI